MISVFILPSNIIFRKTERELSESEIAPARRERERERKKRPNLETNSDEPRNRIRRTQKTQDRACSSSNAQTHSSNPENSFDRTILDPHRTTGEIDRTISNPHRIDRTTDEIVAPQHRSTQNRSFSLHPKTDRPQPRFVVPIHRTQSPLSLSLNLTGFDEFFLLGFVSFVFIYWEMILIFVWKLRKREKMWETW